MKRSLLITLLLALLVLPLVGCSGKTEEEAPVVPSFAKDNNSPEAKNAQGIPPPDTGMPPPGGGMKGKR